MNYFEIAILVILCVFAGITILFFVGWILSKWIMFLLDVAESIDDWLDGVWWDIRERKREKKQSKDDK